MPKHHHRRHGSGIDGKNFIILPILFSAIILISCYIYISVAASSLISLASLFFSDRESDFSESYTNIYVPVAETSDSSRDERETIPISSVTYPHVGEQFGELIIEDCQISDKLFFGDGTIPLNNGVGIYNGSFIPGYGKTILVAGHNNTYFNGLKYAEKGQKVKIRTSYGNYVYEITDIQVKKATDTSAYDLAANYENLIMYTCYPFDELGLTPYLCFVYAMPVSGPAFDKNS